MFFLQCVDLAAYPLRKPLYLIQAFLGLLRPVALTVLLHDHLGLLHHLVALHDHLEKPLYRCLGLVHLLAPREKLDGVLGVNVDASIARG